MEVGGEKGKNGDMAPGVYSPGAAEETQCQAMKRERGNGGRRRPVLRDGKKESG